MSTPASPEALRHALVEFVTQRTDAILRRFLPTLVWPRQFAGYLPARNDVANLIFLLGQLHGLGVQRIAGRSVEDTLRALLPQVDGPRCDTFYSFFVGEAVLRFGPFADNALLAGLTDEQRRNVAAAVDSTAIYDAAAGELRPGYAGNYWAVLARCEFARQRLGLLTDDALLRQCLERVNRVLFTNPLGYWDDDRELTGRYDIYSPDVLLFLEPFWEQLDQAKLHLALRQHVKLLETLALENGATVNWGRSIGALSVCLTMELGANGLKLGMAEDPARMLGLVEHAFAQFKGWYADDLIDAHRYRMTMNYRGPHRLLQMSLDCLSKLLTAAHTLEGVAAPQPPAESPVELFPETDAWVAFDPNRHAGVWMFRNEHFSFQLPLVSNTWALADYMPCPRSPGLLEVPVDSKMVLGVPRVLMGNQEYTSPGIPTRLHKSPGGLHAVFRDFVRCNGEEAPKTIPGWREAIYHVDGDSIHVREAWFFEHLPDAITLNLAESSRPLSLTVHSEQEFRQSVVHVKGMQGWRSFWGEIERVHQVDFVPSNAVIFEYTLTPALKVAHHPPTWDYNRALFDAMPRQHVVERPVQPIMCENDMNLQTLVGGADVLHIGWPEHLFQRHAMSEAEFDQKYLALIEQVGRSGVKVVWTMHNRRPHNTTIWPYERATRIYQAWARVADGVIHHSECGMARMTAELPYKSSAMHVVVPHGHFGPIMQAKRTRAELERAWNLPPCAMRFGVLGRAQPEKKVEMIARAFAQAARPDQQLVLTAVDESTVLPADPRILKLPKSGAWVTREEIAEHNAVCDGIVSAHSGENYLTSGLVADSVGLGMALIAPEWAFFREILGDAGIYHDNTEAGLAALFARLTAADVAKAKEEAVRLQLVYDWNDLALRIVMLYRSLGVNLMPR